MRIRPTAPRRSRRWRRGASRRAPSPHHRRRVSDGRSGHGAARRSFAGGRCRRWATPGRRARAPGEFLLEATPSTAAFDRVLVCRAAKSLGRQGGAGEGRVWRSWHRCSGRLSNSDADVVSTLRLLWGWRARATPRRRWRAPGRRDRPGRPSSDRSRSQGRDRDPLTRPRARDPINRARRDRFPRGGRARAGTSGARPDRRIGRASHARSARRRASPAPRAGSDRS